MSTHSIEVVEVQKEPHPNADTLSVVKIHGWQCVVRTADWNDGDLAAYIPPDYVVPEKPEYEFLRDKDGKFHPRIRVRKLRGYISQGLLMPAPRGVAVGDNVIEQMGITRYVPPEPATMGGDCASPPTSVWHNKHYDVEAHQRFNLVIQPGENVVVTEKIHGANARVVHTEGELWVGSRTTWKKRDEKNIFWKAVIQNPWVEPLARKLPDHIFYGEVFGNVQDLKYGAQKNQYFIRFFDVLYKSEWLSYTEQQIIFEDDQYVPILYTGPYIEEVIIGLENGPSKIEGANHIREGIVIRPVIERQDPELGRVQVKRVSNEYLLR